MTSESTGPGRWRILGPTIACMIACQDDAVELALPTQDEIKEVELEVCRLSYECIDEIMDAAIIHRKLRYRRGRVRGRPR